MFKMYNFTKKELKDVKDVKEIMPRANDIIGLFKLKYNNDEIKNIIQNYPSYKGTNSILDAYFENFTMNSKVMKLLYKYMYGYLNED